MRTVRVDKNRTVEVPTSWKEGEELLTHVLGAYHDRRGGNLARQSAAARTAFGLFGAQFMAPDQTTALVYLLQELCRRKGAGLEKERALPASKLNQE